MKADEQVLSEWSCYGYPRVTAELRRRGVVVNHKRVARIMREHHLTVKPKRNTQRAAIDAQGAPYPNLCKAVVPSGINQLWVGDPTYIRLRSGFVYMAVLIDAWSRRVVGDAISQTMEVRLTLAALNAAAKDRNPPAGLVHHTDRGGQGLSTAVAGAGIYRINEPARDANG